MYVIYFLIDIIIYHIPRKEVWKLYRNIPYSKIYSNVSRKKLLSDYIVCDKV